MSPAPRFEKHTMVRLKHDLKKVGAIWGTPMRTPRGWQYPVFFAANDQPYVLESDLVPNTVDYDFGGINDLLRDLVLIKLRQPLADNIYALYSSRTKFEVYQFKPALKFLSNPDQRLLIADEVGLGKTIEAGIIFLELQSRADVARVLIICPSGLCTKWRDEMRSRFDENFAILNAAGMRTFLDDYRRQGENTRLKGIVSLELARRPEFTQALAEERIHFDLAIIDEAHHCRNTNTQANNLASVLSDNVDAMLLLTATPLHLGNEDLFHLLNILAPGEFDNFDAFNLRLEPNRHINRASRLLAAHKPQEALNTLRQVEATSERQRFVTNPYYQDVVNRLQQPAALAREDLVTIQRHLLDLNTLSHVFTRTQKRDVQENAPIRTAFSLIVRFTPAERQFYNSVIEHVRQQFMWTTGSSWAPAWAVMMRERQVASCISAARERFVQESSGRYLGTSEDETIAQELNSEMDEVEAPRGTAPATTRELLALANEAVKKDTKFEVFLESLRNVLADDSTSNPPKNSKVLVFSFFRGTLDYLYKRLRDLGHSVRVIHGGIDVAERQGIVEDFRDDTRPTILLSSEVGSEGLDFQFCDTLFNYDLPWNPMKVEQRIGRIDRFGQLSARIRIYNLCIADTIEERIFERLYQRIGIFEQAIGDLEVILGEEIRELSKQIFSARLSQSEEIALAEKAATNIVRRKQEMDEFEHQRLQFMGQDAIFANQVEQAIESGRFVSEAELIALVETFIARQFDRCCLDLNDVADKTYSLEPDVKFVQHMHAFVLGSRAADQTSQDFLRKLRAGTIMPITFNAEVAYDRKLVEFVTVRHPLVRAAAKFWENEPHPGLPVAKLALKTEQGIAGNYYYFIYSFNSVAVERNTTLVPIVVSVETREVSPELSAQFLRLVQAASCAGDIGEIQFDREQFEQARQIATEQAANERNNRADELARSNEAMVNARLAAITQTYRIKKQTIERYIQTATEARIRRMREAQLNNIEAKHLLQAKDIESQRSVSVTFSLELAGLMNLSI